MSPIMSARCTSLGVKKHEPLGECLLAFCKSIFITFTEQCIFCLKHLFFYSKIAYFFKFSISPFLNSKVSPSSSADSSQPSSPKSPTLNLLKAWNPMSHDYQSSRNAYSVKTDNLDVAITGYGKKWHSNRTF